MTFESEKKCNSVSFSSKILVYWVPKLGWLLNYPNSCTFDSIDRVQILGFKTLLTTFYHYLSSAAKWNLDSRTSTPFAKSAKQMLFSVAIFTQDHHQTFYNPDFYWCLTFLDYHSSNKRSLKCSKSKLKSQENVFFKNKIGIWVLVLS